MDDDDAAASPLFTYLRMQVSQPSREESLSGHFSSFPPSSALARPASHRSLGKRRLAGPRASLDPEALRGILHHFRLTRPKRDVGAALVRPRSARSWSCARALVGKM